MHVPLSEIENSKIRIILLLWLSFRRFPDKNQKKQNKEGYNQSRGLAPITILNVTKAYSNHYSSALPRGPVHLNKYRVSVPELGDIPSGRKEGAGRRRVGPC